MARQEWIERGTCLTNSPQKYEGALSKVCGRKGVASFLPALRMCIPPPRIRSPRRGCTLISAFLFWIIKDCLFLLGYLSGRQSFLKPLSPEEERAALLRMREGDETARQMLVEHNMRLIVHIARKYKVPGCTFDDLISIGSVGLIKAVRSYDMRTGTSLSTYAARCIENEILMSLRQSRKQQADISLDEPLGTDRDGNAVSFADLLGTPPDMVEDEVRRRVTLDRVRKALPRLPERERLVITLRYGLKDGVMHPQHEIAAMLGISRSYVSRLQYCKRSILKKSLPAHGSGT